MAVNKYLGPTGLTELINLIQADFQKKQDWMQFPEMPAAANYPGKVVQFTGITGASYTKGFFYYSTGLEWTMMSVTSAVEVVSQLPDWATAKDGIIYYVTSESASYIRNASAPGEWLNITGGDNAAFEIVSALPSWDAANPKMIYIVVSDDEATTFVRSSTPGKWYQLSGNTVKAFEIVTALPVWSDADENIIYFLLKDGKLVGNIKNTTSFDAWYTIGGETANIEYVDALPAYIDAEADTLYVVNESGILNLYTKGDTAGQWNELASHEGIPIDDIDDAFDEIFN